MAAMVKLGKNTPMNHSRTQTIHLQFGRNFSKITS